VAVLRIKGGAQSPPLPPTSLEQIGKAVTEVEVEIPSKNLLGEPVPNNAIRSLVSTVTDLMVSEFGEVTSVDATRIYGPGQHDNMDLVILSSFVSGQGTDITKSNADSVALIRDAIVSEVGGDSIGIYTYQLERFEA